MLEEQRTAAAEAWLAEAQQRMANLSAEMADLRIHHEEVATDAKEAGEKLLALLERTRKDEEEAQRVKTERVELLRVSAQHVSELGLIRREREQALGERDEARQECIIARQERDTVKDQLKNATREVSQLAEENHTLTTEVQSLRAVLSHGHEREAAKAKEIEGKCLWLFVLCFLRPVSHLPR